MKKFKISYLDDGKGGSGFWDGPYSKIELIENKYDPQLTDVKVYVLDEDNDDNEIVSFELFGYKIEAIDYDVDEDDDEDDDTVEVKSKSWYDIFSIDYFDLAVGILIGYFIFHH